MHHQRLLGGVSFIALALSAIAAPSTLAAPAASEPSLLDVIVVTAPRADTVTTAIATPDHMPAMGADASQLLSQIPGGARNGNGPLSGQVQYRGLFGQRLNVRVDGQRFGSGGPNLMDPPFHYAPMPLIAALEIDRGVSPVRNGPGLAGGVNAVFKQTEFGDTEALHLNYDLTGLGRSVDDSFSAGGIVGAANDRLRFNLLGAYEDGGDMRFPGGTVGGTSFERGVYGAAAGIRLDDHEFGFSARRQNTGPTGNPPFPMDIRYFDSDFARLTYKGGFDSLRIEAGVGYSDVEHAMNNFALRAPPASPAQYRETFADATTVSGDLAATLPLGGGVIRIGADAEDIARNTTITNPNNAAFTIANLPDIQQQRIGVYAEWTGDLGRAGAELGLRADTHKASAGTAATGPAVPAGAAALAAVFNAADRDREDTTADAVARLWGPVEDGLIWRVTVARKTRVPNHVERFAWLPTEASGGLADGNIYVGSLDLKPETAWIAEAGFDWTATALSLRPTLYYRHIDNYIQGVPFDSTPGVINTPQEMIANMNGDPTPLRFANVDARLYGFDFDAAYQLTEQWRLHALASYTRGERREINDNLYRVSPPSLTAGVSYLAPRWTATVESRLVAEQDKVSVTNSETETGGYGILNAYGEVALSDRLHLSAGVENILDTHYADHLGGYNRIAGSDVPVGARLPGAGIGAYLRLNIAN